MAIFWKEKLLAFKIETTEGVDAGPAGSDVVLAKNITLNPMEGQDLSRELERDFFGDQGTVPVDLHMTLSFEVELAGSGAAGTAPAWGPILRACAVAETIDAGTSVTYNPITNGQESATVHFHVGGTRYAMLGTRGTAKLDVSVSAIPKITFEMTGLFTLPTAQTKPAGDYSDWFRPVAGSTDNTPTVELDSTPLVTRSIMLDLGNQVEPRFLIGSKGILITGKSEKVEMQVEATPIATFDPIALANSQAELDLTLVHGTAAGNIVTLNVPKAQMQRPGAATVVQDILEWPLNLVPIPDTGNDQWTLTLT